MMKQTKRVFWRGSEWRELTDFVCQSVVADTLATFGYRMPARHACTLRRNTFVATRDLYKCLRHIADQAHLSVLETDTVPCLIVATHVMHHPCCLVVLKHCDGRMPRMFVTRHRFCDARLFDGTVIEATLHPLTRTAKLFDIVAYRGFPVGLSIDRRHEILSDIVNVQHLPEDGLNHVSFACASSEACEGRLVQDRVAEIKQSSPDSRILISSGLRTWLLLV